MAMRHSGGDVVPFHGDHHPVSVVQGRKSRNLWSADSSYSFTTYSGNPGITAELVAGKRYTISADIETTNVGQQRFLVYSVTAGKSLCLLSGNGTRKSATFTAGYDTSRVFLYAGEGYANANGFTATWSNIMLEEGGTQHAYEPYGAVTDTIFKPTLLAKSGTAPMFERSYNDVAEVGVAGKSEQVQLSGKNLLDIDKGEPDGSTITNHGVTVSRNGDTFTVSGSNTKHDANYGVGFTFASSSKNPGYLLFEPGKMYTLSTSEPLPKGFYIGINTHNGTSQIGAGNYLFGDGKIKSTTFTVPSTSTGFVYLFAGVLKETEEISETTFRIQLEAGSAATPYEPYVGGIPSPSPDYPQPITSIDSVELVARGRNLFDPSKMLYAAYSGGVPIQATWMKPYKVSFPYTPVTRTYGIGYLIEAKAGESYTASYKGDKDFAAVSYATYKTAEDITNGANRLSYVDGGSRRSTVTCTATQDCVIMFLFASAYYQDEIVTYNMEDCVIESGYIAHPYEPYHSTTRTIDLQGNKLRSLPDGTKDELVVHREGRVQLVQRVGVVVVSGTESGGYGRHTTGLPYFSVSSCITDSRSNNSFNSMMCSAYTVSNWTNNKDKAVYDPNHRDLVFTDYGFTDIATARAILAKVRPVVLYPLATPQTIALPSIDPLPTYWPTTVIYDQDGNDISAFVKVVDDAPTAALVSVHSQL